MPRTSENAVFEPGGTVIMTSGDTAVAVDAGSSENVVYLSNYGDTNILENKRPKDSGDIVASIRQAVSDLWDSPAGFQDFLSRLPDGFRAVCAYDRPNDSENDVIDLAIIINQCGEGQIYAPRPDSSEQNLLYHTVELRAVLSSAEPWSGFEHLTPRWAYGVAELLQLELSNSESSDSHRRKCLKYLRSLCRQFSILPPSYFLHDLVREGNYPISGGGFSDIYKGYSKSGPVCIKALRMFTNTTDIVQKFKDFSNEALVWKQLKHPNVLPFLGVSTELSPRFCLVSPWMENGNVNSFLEKNPDHDRLRMLSEIAEGLRYLHDCNPQIIHGDVRGANIMIDSSKTCCLADFGLALVTGSQTTSSSGHGTFRWMAPEILLSWKGQEKIPSSRDVYAFACTALEIYTGQPPYAEIGDGQVLAMMNEGKRPPRPVKPIAPIADQLWDLIEECWVEHAASRPSALKILQVLRSISSIPSVASQETLSSLPKETESTIPVILLEDFDQAIHARDRLARHRTPWRSKDSLSSVASSTPELIPQTPAQDILNHRSHHYWRSKDSLSSVASSVSGLSLYHLRVTTDSEPVTANTSFRTPTPSPVIDGINAPESVQAWVDDSDPVYDSPDCSVAHLDAGEEEDGFLGDRRANSLMYGVSHGFNEPMVSTLSFRSLDASCAIPQDIHLRYGSYQPFHIQAPSWQDLLHLLKGHPETVINVDVPEDTIAPSEFSLRVVCQFVKPPLARQWRTIIWLTVDYPLPRIEGKRLRGGYEVKNLPRSYTLASSALPSLLKESEKNSPMCYTIPQTKDLPYPSLPISLPDLAIYLEASMDQSRRSLSKRWRRSHDVELLARMVDCCNNDDIPAPGNGFLRKLQRAFHIPRWPKTF
ncbi:hypothetical protein VKT23_001634 [Stygiomarasmius scandens]|uniref:Protein kinase domain-containing protein n=1 Tax=Marasmiellus scandens TaxID=2682957 RepID=A0ABR1K1K1_9AGAR